MDIDEQKNRNCSYLMGGYIKAWSLNKELKKRSINADEK